MVDRLDGGVGIVDRRGQRPVGDVDQAAQAEQHVLDHGALEADENGFGEGRSQHRRGGWWPVGGARPGPGDGCARHDVVTDPSDQPDDQVVGGGGVDQRGRLDGLEVAGGGHRQDHGMGGWVGAAVLGLQVVGGVAVDVVDDFVGLVLDLAHDGVDLDGAGQVVDEVDEHPTLARASPRDPETASRGTKAGSPARWTPTLYSPAVL